MTEHTPIPWNVETGNADGDKLIWIGSPGNDICDLYHKRAEHGVDLVEHFHLKENAEANAEFIVTAVNSHDGLLEALEQAAMELEEASKILQPLRPGCADIFETAAEQKRAAIKAARP
ncbi:MAG: hypothetical protein KAI73_05755 [Rhodospirillaceae bacterium]|nr:hypothetical protein [Rhodospirillaceae bacterium]